MQMIRGFLYFVFVDAWLGLVENLVPAGSEGAARRWRYAACVLLYPALAAICFVVALALYIAGLIRTAWEAWRAKRNQERTP